MNHPLNRRAFLKRSALAAGAMSAAPLIHVPNIIAAPGPSDILNCVQVGCGVRGFNHLDAVIGSAKQNLVAIVDPDPKAHAQVRNWMNGRNLDGAKLQAFTDYREMFDKVGKQVDAVFVTTPNHHHATVAITAMQLGKNVYCEKPVCHDVAEARRLRKMASDNPKLATQMGNQGHCMEGYISLCEYIWGGTIGNVTETHSWTDRNNGGVGPRPAPSAPPAGMNWDQWIGPAPYREFHTDLHPHEWHGWYDFGNGAIGNMGCHVLDGVYWALKIDHPTAIEAEYMRGGTDERYPTGSRVRWDIPARGGTRPPINHHGALDLVKHNSTQGGMPPVKVYWYEGHNPASTNETRPARGASKNLPPILFELREKYPLAEDNLDRMDSGTIYIGDKGYIYTGTYGDNMHIVPYAKMQETPKPAKTLPRPKGIFVDFITACREGRSNTAAPFEYGTRLTEFSILANLAQHVGVGKKLEWDGPNMKVKNMPELDAWLKREYRKGWQI